MVKYFNGGPVARGQRSAFFAAYKKILYLIGLKYPIAFPFWSKIENSHKIIERKNMVKLFGGVQGSIAHLPKKILHLKSIKYTIYFPFWSKINNNNHINGNIFSLSHFFQTSFQHPEVTLPPCPLATPLQLKLETYTHTYIPT